ncbi:MAG: prevent-host-death family protein [Bryobacteraceae bacterium]
MNATIVDLRYHMKDVLRAIDRGETVTVLYRGKRKARLTPIAASSEKSSTEQSKTKDQPFFGMWSDRADLADPTAYVRSIRRPRPVADASVPKRRRK